MPNCDCARPWPEMIQLHLCPPNRYYLCRQCGAIREDVCLPGGLVARTQRYPSQVRPQFSQQPGIGKCLARFFAVTPRRWGMCNQPLGEPLAGNHLGSLAQMLGFLAEPTIYFRSKLKSTLASRTSITPWTRRLLLHDQWKRALHRWGKILISLPWADWQRGDRGRRFAGRPVPR